MRRVLIALVVVVACARPGDALQNPPDVTEWRGTGRDGVVTGFTAPETWPEELVERWTAEVGTGYATPLVVGDRVYQFSRIGQNMSSTAFAADRDHGRMLANQ